MQKLVETKHLTANIFFSYIYWKKKKTFASPIIIKSFSETKIFPIKIKLALHIYKTEKLDT